MSMIMRSAKLAIFIALTLPWQMPAQSGRAFVLLPDSRITIAGQASWEPFEFHSTDLYATASVSANQEQPMGLVSQPVEAAVSLHVPVKSLQSGNPLMDKDMHTLLAANGSSCVLYSLDSSRVLEWPAAQQSWVLLTTYGTLQIAGEQRNVEMQVKIRSEGTIGYRLRGGVDVKMTDFGIKPPRKLFGLIRVRDEIRVNFELIAIPASGVDARSKLVRTSSTINHPCATPSGRAGE